MLKCPKCRSTKIDQYRTIVGPIWCSDCSYSVPEKEKFNPFIIEETPTTNGDPYKKSEFSSKVVKKDTFKDTVKEATKNLNQNMRIDQMQEVRKSNNDNWMQLLKIALKYAPEETKKVLMKITNSDKQISVICEKIINEK